MRWLFLSLAVIAWSAEPIVAPKTVPVASPVMENVASAEFDALYAQASDALERLRASQERRMAMASPGAL